MLHTEALQVLGFEMLQELLTRRCFIEHPILQFKRKELASEIPFEHASFATLEKHFLRGEIVQKLHEARETAVGIVINAGAFTHYSYAIRDAIDVTGLPVMEVHISNIHERESFRHTSVIRAVCVGQIAGFGIKSYTMGLEQLVNDFILKKTPVAKPAETE